MDFNGKVHTTAMRSSTVKSRTCCIFFFCKNCTGALQNASKHIMKKKKKNTQEGKKETYWEALKKHQKCNEMHKKKTNKQPLHAKTHLDCVSVV